jgi:abortive infection bacteriophage resistance protein
MKIPYQKRALTFKDQIEQLKSRGLIIEDENAAFECLQHISYYRLSAYMYPFLTDKKNHIFKKDVKFQNILNIYNFDRELRLLLNDAIERIEISFRTNLIYVLAHKYNPFWIVNKKLFYDPQKFENNIAKLKEELGRSDEKFLQHYFEKYSEDIPPAWISLEIASFGLLSLFYSNLRYNKDQKEIANRFGLNRKVFISWFHSLTYVRNLCAHHARVWNRELAIQPAIPQSTGGVWLKNIRSIKNNRIFIVIAIIIYFLSIINSSSQFEPSFLKLVKKYKDIDLAAMGFPLNWENESLFKD